MLKKAFFCDFCCALRRVLFASVVCFVCGVGSTWAYDITYNCGSAGGNYWLGGSTTPTASMISCNTSGMLYGWCCQADGFVNEFLPAQAINYSGNEDLVCKALWTTQIPSSFTYHIGNCSVSTSLNSYGGNPYYSVPIPRYQTEHCNDVTMDYNFGTFDILAPYNTSLAWSSATNIFTDNFEGLSNCVTFDYWKDYVENITYDASNCTSGINGTCGTRGYNMPGDIYAHCTWTPYTVVYNDCDGNSHTVTNSVVYGSTWTMPSYDSATGLTVPTGYSFDGWTRSGSTYSSGDSFTLNECLSSGTQIEFDAVCTCNTADNYWWNADNTACVQGYTITLQILPAINTPAPTYSTQPTTLYTIPTRGAYLDADRTLLMTKTANPIELPYLEIMLDFDTNAPINPVDDAQYFVSNVDSINLAASYHCFAHPNIAGGIYQGHGYTSGTCFIHKNPENYTTTTISGLTPENRDGYLTDAGIYEAENQYQNQTWFITGRTWDDNPSVANPTLTGYTFVNWCTDTAGTTSCFKGLVPNNAQAGTYYAHWTANHYSVTYNPGAHATSGSTSYTDSYDSDLGTGGATYDSPYSPLDFDTAPISDNMSADTGYVFVGWTTDVPANQTITNGVVANQYTGDTYWKRTSALQLYAAYDCNTSNGYSWNAEHTQCINEYTVTFLPGDSNNDGTGTAATGSTASITGKHMGDTITLPQSAFTAPIGYEFDKWFCDNGFGYKNVQDTFQMPAADVTCTAQWKSANYTLTYIANPPAAGVTVTGMPDPNPASVTAGTNYTLANSPAAEGYISTGWLCTDENDDEVEQIVGETIFSVNKIVMPQSHVTCAAQWTESMVNLRWNLDNGIGDLTNYTKSCHYGVGNITLGPHPTKQGHKFIGWKVTNWECDLSLIDASINGNSFSDSHTGTVNGTWQVDFSYGELSGLSKCVEANNPEIDCPVSEGIEADTACPYCYCKLTSYTPTNGSQCNISSTSWISNGSFAGNCVNSCATFCGMRVRTNYTNLRTYILIQSH